MFFSSLSRLASFIIVIVIIITQSPSQFSNILSNSSRSQGFQQKSAPGLGSLCHLVKDSGLLPDKHAISISSRTLCFLFANFDMVL
jgi:hypothetical protein